MGVNQQFMGPEGQENGAVLRSGSMEQSSVVLAKVAYHVRLPDVESRRFSTLKWEAPDFVRLRCFPRLLQ